jgi:hypothetical protein
VNLTGLPAFGTCCALDTVAVPPVPVIAGKQYWVIAIPGASDTWDAWNWSNSAYGTLAENEGSGWFSEGYEPQGAFDVLGDPCGPPVPPRRRLPHRRLGRRWSAAVARDGNTGAAFNLT